jgi:hypothetical protein
VRDLPRFPRPAKDVPDCSRYDFAKTFDILVGPEKKRLTVHHDILTQRSGFFEAARSCRWVEGPQVATDLSHHDADDVSNYLQLVYTGTLPEPDVKVTQWCDSEHSSEKYDNAREQVNSHYEVLVKLYMLADELEDLASCNMTMDGILEFGDRVGKMLPWSLIRRVYDNTPSSSRLRVMIRDLIIYEVHADYFENSTTADHPKQLLLDIAVKYLRIKWEEIDREDTATDPYTKVLSERLGCRYHQHDGRHRKCEQ